VTTLFELLNFVVTTLQTSSIVENTRVVETIQFSEAQFSLKVRAHLASGEILQVRIYQNGKHVDYAYQLLQEDKPLIRWDNKEHFRNISTFPNHFHNNKGSVENSPLCGDPFEDLTLVLTQCHELHSRG
jgi:hypothetical protein